MLEKEVLNYRGCKVIRTRNDDLKEIQEGLDSREFRDEMAARNYKSDCDLVAWQDPVLHKYEY